MYLRRLGSDIEAVMGLSKWHMCFKIDLEEPFHATKPRSTFFFDHKNHRLHAVDTFQENRSTHLTYAPDKQPTTWQRDRPKRQDIRLSHIY